MWKHCQKQHSEINQKFTMEIVDKCRGDPTKRQILEANRIRNTDTTLSMNDRNEWNFILIPKASVE